jgi:hypothetical protein
LVRQSKLDGITHQRDLVRRFECDVGVMGEPPPLEGENRFRVAHANQDSWTSMLEDYGERRFQEAPGFLHRLPVEQLGSDITRFDADAMPRTRAVRRIVAARGWVRRLVRPGRIFNAHGIG